MRKSQWRIMNSINDFSDNNNVSIVGIVQDEPKINHEIYGEKFYIFNLLIRRLSNSFDEIPVLISERLIEVSQIVKDKPLSVEGQYRSYNNMIGNKSKLVLNVFAREAKFIDAFNESMYRNEVFFDGYICKKPNYRTTPFGREISDILLAVNRAYNKSDYIPCICWGRNARFCERLEIGKEIKVWGRIQSRFYEKKYDEQIVKRVAYEVSVNKLEDSNE
ncbi:MAG: single-stranded DNA-binding protein [Clostridia bacterium]|nr:single-stranded DNA-binding protein [Clostridia bacterium]